MYCKGVFMKILTINTHSLMEENYEERLMGFVDAVAVEKPQIIALQEVNQTRDKKIASMAEGYFSSDERIVIREDNFMLNAVKLLKEKGITYYWTWLPLKKGYDIYDEGIGFLSLSPILETNSKCVSKVEDYNNWKTRKILGIRTKNSGQEWFFNVHYGWWNDDEEPFLHQWKRTDSYLSQYKDAWIMGDFNNPAEVRNEGYDEICYHGWKDSFLFGGDWKHLNGMKMNQIWFKNKKLVNSHRVIFDGDNYPVISDHLGVIVEYENL